MRTPRFVRVAHFATLLVLAVALLALTGCAKPTFDGFWTETNGQFSYKIEGGRAVSLYPDGTTYERFDFTVLDDKTLRLSNSSLHSPDAVIGYEFRAGGRQLVFIDPRTGQVTNTLKRR